VELAKPLDPKSEANVTTNKDPSPAELVRTAGSEKNLEIDQGDKLQDPSPAELPVPEPGPALAQDPSSEPSPAEVQVSVA